MKITPAIAALGVAAVLTVAGTLGQPNQPRFSNVAVPTANVAYVAGQARSMSSPIVTAALLATRIIQVARFVLTTLALARALQFPPQSTVRVPDQSTLDQ